MAKFSTTFEIDKEVLDKAVDEVLAGDRRDVVARIAGSFVPRADDVRSQIEEMKKRFPLLADIPNVTMDGLTRATVGSIEDDLDGRTIQGMTERFAMQAPLLDRVIRVFVGQNIVTAGHAWEIVSDSPVFEGARQGAFERAIDRYLRADWISTVHVLVPMVEDALRRLLGTLGGVTESRRGDVYMAKGLGAVLSDPVLKQFWTDVGLPDVPLYLQALLTDHRGWNLRNRVAHGLCDDTFFNRQVADRLLHVVLLLSLVRSAEDPNRQDEKDWRYHGHSGDTGAARNSNPPERTPVYGLAARGTA